jgi:hypothetical protein
MNRTKMIRLAGAAAAVGALGLAGATLANAESTPTPSPSAPRAPGDHGRGQEHTAVTGDELDRVTAAVKAKDSAVTVTRVEKDEDGSYDVEGTKAGAPVRLEVSADLKTVEVHAGGPGGHGRMGKGAEVTGAERANVEKAATAKVSGLAVEDVRKRPDGSYVVRGTKAGAPVRVEVSKDLTTVTEESGWGPGGRPGKGPMGKGPMGKGFRGMGPMAMGAEVTGAERANVEKAATAKVSGLAVEDVRKRPDGGYVVRGTKAGAPVRVEVSKDLKTVTEQPGWGPGGHPGKGPWGERGNAPTPTPDGTS